MLADHLQKALRFYFITDDHARDFAVIQQVRTALQAGATMIQYRRKSFSVRYWEEVRAVRDICKCNGVPFVVNDDLLLAKAVGADGIHLGQDDEDPIPARSLLGSQAIIGLSVSTLKELNKSNLETCDYLGTGPVFGTRTKADAKAVIGLDGLKTVTDASAVPVVAIGGVDQTHVQACFKHGAAGVAVISAISRADDPLQAALQLSAACGCVPRSPLASPWEDEFALINRLTKHASHNHYLKVPPGDDACLLASIARPVITTDTQKEGVHFRLEWQTPMEIGHKAAEITFSDLAAAYAVPVSFFVNLALPAYIAEHTVEALYAGIRKALEKQDCSLGGGNISAGQRLSLDCFAIGRGHDQIFPSRANALSGYGLYCTGPLGLARAGLDCLKRKDATFVELIDKFKSPAARFDAARVLADSGVNCVIDVSDGLAGDAEHIARASGLSIELEISSSSFHPVLVAFCEKYRLDPWEMVVAGGEDYELLFACSAGTFEKVAKQLPEAYQVGSCLAYKGRYLINVPVDMTSFRHGHKRYYSE